MPVKYAIPRPFHKIGTLLWNRKIEIGIIVVSIFIVGPGNVKYFIVPLICCQFKFISVTFKINKGILVATKCSLSIPVIYYRKVIFVKKSWRFFQIAQICSLNRGFH